MPYTWVYLVFSYSYIIINSDLVPVGSILKHTCWCISSNSSLATTFSDKVSGVSFKFSSRYINISVVHKIKASTLFS